MTKSTKPKSADKPAKPYKDFPLFPHASGRWAKKIKGQFAYFGKWADGWQAALANYERDRERLYQGLKPLQPVDGYTLRDLLNRFLVSKRGLLDTSEITNRTFEGYKLTCDWLAKILDLDRPIVDFGPDDFEKVRASFGNRYGLTGLGNEINKTRVVFKYGFDAELIDRPVRFGPNFKRPSRTAMRKMKATRGKRMFEAHELRTLIEAAGVQLKAMLLLAANGGLGNADLGLMPMRALDLDRGWCNYPRPKTGIERRFPLWPETVEAIKAALTKRPKHKDPKDAQLVFVTAKGGRWHKDTADNALSKEVAKLLKATGLKRDGLNFYACRHGFETIAGGTRDQVAVNHIMGHSPAPSDMASVYREHIEDERLVAVVEHVRRWLYPPVQAAQEPARLALVGAGEVTAA